MSGCCGPCRWPAPAFKKTYYDPDLWGGRSAMFVPAEDFVVPYGATDLLSAPRYTHVLKRYANEIRKLQVSGFYRDVTLPEPAPDYSDVQRKTDDLKGESPTVEYRRPAHLAGGPCRPGPGGLRGPGWGGAALCGDASTRARRPCWRSAATGSKATSARRSGCGSRSTPTSRAGASTASAWCT
jgi:hypothetical protein